jgi:hypothetical protein
MRDFGVKQYCRVSGSLNQALDEIVVKNPCAAPASLRLFVVKGWAQGSVIKGKERQLVQVRS